MNSAPVAVLILSFARGVLAAAGVAVAEFVGGAEFVGVVEFDGDVSLLLAQPTNKIVDRIINASDTDRDDRSRSIVFFPLKLEIMFRGL